MMNETSRSSQIASNHLDKALDALSKGNINDAKESINSANSMLKFGYCKIPDAGFKDSISDLMDGRAILNGFKFNIEKLNINKEIGNYSKIELILIGPM